MNYPAYLEGNTVVSTARLDLIRKFVLETESLPGVIAEVGVWRGGTARWICDHTEKSVFLFDTFEGMPEVTEKDLHRKGDFSNTSLSHVSILFMDYAREVSIYRGRFPRENSEAVADKQFSLVHLDVDIYESVKECLEFFYPRMVPGGIIILDDYNAPTCPGAKLAADEFCVRREVIVEPTAESQAIIRIKRKLGMHPAHGASYEEGTV